MTHISILDEEIKGLDCIKARLEERDTFVSVIKSFEDLKNLQTSTLVVSEKKVKSTSGTDIKVGCDIICVHSDTPNAVEIIKSLKKALKKK